MTFQINVSEKVIAQLDELKEEYGGSYSKVIQLLIDESGILEEEEEEESEEQE